MSDKQRRVHRYAITEAWGDPPSWVTEMVGAEDHYILDVYRGPFTQWEIERGGEIVYGFAGEHVGRSPVAMAQGVDA